MSKARAGDIPGDGLTRRALTSRHTKQRFGDVSARQSMARAAWRSLRGWHREAELCPVGSRGQRFASHQFDRWPVLMKEAPCIVEIVRLDSNAAGLSAGTVRYLKVEIESDRFFWVRLIIVAHLVSPRYAWRILGV